jgi:hypothetical protein
MPKKIENKISEGELYHLDVHGYTEFYLKKDDEFYSHYWNSKKKIFDWHPTLIAPERVKKMIPIKNIADLIGIMNMLRNKQPHE